MTGPGLSAAKAVLLAVQLVSKADLSTLRSLVAQQRKALRTDIILRIILSHLPESLESAFYVPFLQELVSGEVQGDSNFPVDVSQLDELSGIDASQKVRKLNLLPLRWANAPPDAPTDPLVLFLIHRSLRVDEATGLITQLPELLAPFLHHSTYLRNWTISTILPLLRFNYEYHPQDSAILTIPTFESLDDRSGIALMLSRTGGAGATNPGHDNFVGRDLRGLVGPWMYGDTRWKRRKLKKCSSWDVNLIAPLDEAQPTDYKFAGWEEVFKWMTMQATTSWQTTVEVVEQWDGPGDVDLGGYEDRTTWFDEDEQQHLEKRYARAALASAYLIPEASVDALNGICRILLRITVLLNLDEVPTLQAAAALLIPVTGLERSSLLSPTNAVYLRNGLLEEQNVLTHPNKESIKLILALLISAYLLTRAGHNSTLRRAGELALIQDEREQKSEFMKTMFAVSNGPKGDDKYWVRMRNEILWLQSWGAEEAMEGADTVKGRGIGIFGTISMEFIEAELLKALLANNRYTLARSVYETAPDRPLSSKRLQDTIISAAMNAYDNATNANRTRGGVRRCNDILQAFPDTLSGSIEKYQMEHLISVTHAVGEYRLVFKQGEPFTPVILRVHGDPISIIGKILDQNPRSYTKMNEFVQMGRDMVKAGLTVRSAEGRTVMTEEQVHEQTSIAEKRVVSMCIDAALAEDDFETAYSYVVTRLKDIAGPAHARVPDLERKSSGLFAEPPPRRIDDWSWRAALQAGKYRRTGQTVRPTHLGNASGNLEIRHLEQRMDCLAQALRLAPKSTLQEILNVYRRCEEELDSHAREEAEQEAAWEMQDDEQSVPGGFTINLKKGVTSNIPSRSVEEAPVSLFDLSRAGMTRAQSGFSALSMLRGNKSTPSKTGLGSSRSPIDSRVSTPDSLTNKETVRKRDQLKNAAVGTLATGIGWLINAPPVASAGEDHDNP